MTERLDNNEHVLLMYLADELCPEDRREIEQMLAVDAGLRNELQRLEDGQQAVFEGLWRLDQASPMAASEAAAVRRVSAEIRRRLAKPQTIPGERIADPRRRSLWWVYPTAAAAVVILAAALWMPRHDNTRRPIVSIGGVSRDYGYGYPYGAVAQLYEDSWDPIERADDPDVRAPSDELLAMSESPREPVAPFDPLNQLLLSADVNQ